MVGQNRLTSVGSQNEDNVSLPEKDVTVSHVVNLVNLIFATVNEQNTHPFRNCNGVTYAQAQTGKKWFMSCNPSIGTSVGLVHHASLYFFSRQGRAYLLTQGAM